MPNCLSGSGPPTDVIGCLSDGVQGQVPCQDRTGLNGVTDRSSQSERLSKKCGVGLLSFSTVQNWKEAERGSDGRIRSVQTNGVCRGLRCALVVGA